MMNALPTLIVVWAVFTGLFLSLLAYNGTVSRYEENQLFLDMSAHEERFQTSILTKINKVMPYIRATGTISGVLTVLIIGIYTLDCWRRLQQ